MALVCGEGQLPCRPTTTDGQPKTSAVCRSPYGGNRWSGRSAAQPFPAGDELRPLPLIDCTHKLIINYGDFSQPPRAGIEPIRSRSASSTVGESIGVELRPSCPMFQGEIDEMHRSGSRGLLSPFLHYFILYSIMSKQVGPAMMAEIHAADRPAI